MAYADYTHCGLCDTKVFYDASVDYEWNTGDWTALCINCAKTHKIMIRNNGTGELTKPKNIFIEGIIAERNQAEQEIE
jgi:hypothetical protein